MHTLKGRVLVTILSVSLSVAILIFGCAISSTPDMGTTDKNEDSKPEAKQNNIPIQGAITHVHEPDGSLKTTIDIVIGKEFTGNLPEDIDSISVTGPKGDLTLEKSDFSYYPQFRDFWISIPGSPAIGTYTFTVTSGDKTGSATDTQTALKTIPIPDTGTFSPSEGKALTCKMPSFTWNAVEAGIPLYYRLEIMDMQNNSIYRTNYGEDVLFIRLPPDLLKVGQTYRWRVRAVDGANWISLNNRSNSQWSHFSVGKIQSECEYKYQIPTDTGDGWETSSIDEEGVDSAKIDELVKNILEGKFLNTHSVLLVKNGKLILEEYFNGYNREDLHYLASATKSITSILVGISLDANMLKNVDQKVYEFFPDYQTTDWIDKKYEITVRHLLSMTSGIEWDENRPATDPQHDYYGMRRGGDWMRYLFNKKMVAQPGQKFNYNGGLSALLGEIVRRTTGLNAEGFSERYLFDPLGISHYSWLRYNDGSINTGGGLLLKPRDMAKIGQMMLNYGKYNGKQIVSEEWITESTQSYVVPKLGSGYGYQWWLGEVSVNGQTIKTYFAQGLGGQYIFVIPKMKITAIFTSQLKDNPSGFFRPQVMMTEYIIPALLPPAPLYEVITLDQSVLQDYVGEYEYKRWNIKASVTRKDKKIFILPSDLEKTELFPISETAFRGNLKGIGGIEVDFPKNDNDKIDHMTVRIGFSLLNFDKIK
jgi:CubicO group peptidase (beta-lactamase class C family)